jgi:hypothetical protein
MREWMELELAEALRPVAAPPGLRMPSIPARAQSASREPAVFHNWNIWAAWPAAALATLLLVAGMLWFAAQSRHAPTDLRLLAANQLRDPSPLDVRSSDPAELTRWLRRQVGVDLSLPACVEGGRLLSKSGTPAAAIMLRIRNDQAALLVAHTGSGMSWRAVGLNPDAGCLHCHANL